MAGQQPMVDRPYGSGPVWVEPSRPALLHVIPPGLALSYRPRDCVEFVYRDLVVWTARVLSEPRRNAIVPTALFEAYGVKGGAVRVGLIHDESSQGAQLNRRTRWWTET